VTLSFQPGNATVARLGLQRYLVHPLHWPCHVVHRPGAYAFSPSIYRFNRAAGHQRFRPRRRDAGQVGWVFHRNSCSWVVCRHVGRGWSALDRAGRVSPRRCASAAGFWCPPSGVHVHQLWLITGLRRPRRRDSGRFTFLPVFGTLIKGVPTAAGMATGMASGVLAAVNLVAAPLSCC